MVLEVGLAKLQQNKIAEDNSKNRNRLDQRLQKCGLKEKREIPGDGNCQFTSISDQLFNTLENTNRLRLEAVQWLRQHKDWKLPENGAVLSDFACDMAWNEFCDHMAKNGIWGNHITLLAIAELYQVTILVVSSVENEDSFIIEINPFTEKHKQQLQKRTIYLSHYAEYHYGSLCKA